MDNLEKMTIILNKHLIKIISEYIYYPVKYHDELLIKTQDIKFSCDLIWFYKNIIVFSEDWYDTKRNIMHNKFQKFLHKTKYKYDETRWIIY